MPFNFLKYQHYSINYSKFFDELNSIQFLNDKYIQSEYLKSWMKVLENSDRTIANQLKTKEQIANFSLLLQSEPEIFQLPIDFKNNKIFIHFRASIANQIISKDESKSAFIPLDEFVGDDSSIKWTSINANVDSYANSKKPIMLVPFLDNQYNYLVIDGNHRLTYKINNKINDVHALIFSEQTVIEQSLFSSGFDKFYYIMHNEINHMGNETNSKRTKAIELVKKSYLNGETFKFSET